MPQDVFIGIDLGGTKIEGIALAATDARDPRPTIELDRRRVPTPKGDYDAGLDAIARLVADIEAHVDVHAGVHIGVHAGPRARIGVGIPGSVSPATGRVRNANSTWLNGKPLAQDLARRLDRPVRLANDANCLALSEATDGAGRDARVVFGVVLGTGVGGGLVVDGQLIEGRNGIGGEWGHSPLPWPTPGETAMPPCWCGRTGCNETFLSGPALAADHRRETGRHLSAEEIAARAGREGPEAGACRATLERHLERLARALATVVNLADPDVIVLGGGLSRMAHLYDALPGRLERLVFSDVFETPIRPAAHGDSSGVRGAAWLWAS